MLVEFEVKSSERTEIIDISSRVIDIIGKSKIDEGIALVASAHTTAAITINENADPDVPRDIDSYLQKMIPRDHSDFRHAEGNSDSHIKVSLVGPSVNLIISGGKAVLGTWQGIFFCEFDGPRTRKVRVKIIQG